jgi:sugar phosphate isomerase/epimerase
LDAPALAQGGRRLDGWGDMCADLAGGSGTRQSAGHEAAGHGKLDYDRYLSLLYAYGFRGPLLLHGLSEAQVPGCVAFLRDKLARAAAAGTKSVPGSI